MAVDLVPEIALLLRTCLCDALNAQPNPPSECCFVLPGDALMDMGVDGDICCSGRAYVSVGDMWVSSNSFPEQDIVRQAQARCAPPAWGFDLKMGILRCAPTMGETELDPITCTQWNEAATQQWADSKALRVAACCFRNAYPSLNPQLDGMSVVIGRMAGGSPQGGCTDRYVNLQVQIPSVCDDC